MQRLGLRLFSLVFLSLWASIALAQVYPNIPANTFLGRLGSGNPGPPQPIPFGLLSGQVLSNISGDCTVNAGGVITCTKTNGVNFGTFSTQNFATPPVIGGTTPNAGTFSALTATGTLTTNVTGSTQCAQLNSSGILGGSGSACGGATGTYVLSHVTGAWVCTGPTGNVVSTFGTTTSGLQECINAMQTNNDGSFRAICPNPGGNVPISATTMVTFGPSAGGLYDLRGCLFKTSAAVGITLDTLDFGAGIDWSSGLIECTGATSECVYFNPTHADPLFGNYGISWGFIKLPTIFTSSCASNGANGYAVRFSSGNNGPVSTVDVIFGEKIEIGAIDGFDGSHFCPTYGIEVDNPTNAFNAFGQNYIYVGYIEGINTIYVGVGTSILTQATQALATNHWDIGSIGTNGSATTAVSTFGFLDQWYVNISVNGGSLTTGFNFGATTANGNWFVIPQLAGTTKMSDNGTVHFNAGYCNGKVNVSGSGAATC